MKKITLFFLLAFALQQASAQSAEDSVKAVVKQLFAAMKNSDAASLKACFADSAILQTITSSGSISNEDIGALATQIASLPKGAADEQITFDVLKVDDGLALAWTPYKFFYNGHFQHCGVDSFQLVRINGRWKIQYLIDTRRKAPCP